MTEPKFIPPLTGIRVLDFSQYLPGPYATRRLCDLGADVIKVEPPAGDPLRTMFGGTSGRDSMVYRLLNQGKVVARLNLKDRQTANALLPVITQADVLLESFRPGVMARLGLDYPRLRSHHPGLVYCSLSGYGQDGPLRLAGGHDINYCAAAGLFSHADVNSPPGVLMADHSGAVNAVNTILAALVGRRQHDQGSFLDVSLYESILSYQYPALIGAAEAVPDLSVLTGAAACYNFYHTSDQRTVTLGALEPIFWRRFCQSMEKVEWIDRQYEAIPQTALMGEVQEAVGELTLAQLTNRLEGVDCCFEPVPQSDEIHLHRQTQARQLFACHKLAYPARINDIQPMSPSSFRDLPVGDLPTWTTCHNESRSRRDI